LFLPVFKSGGRVWAGDANAAQGDGVVDQASIETAMEELRVQYDVHNGVSLAGPTVETPTHWIVMACADSLDSALTGCVRAAIDWLDKHAGLDRRDGYALCSMAVSFRVTQFADQTGSVYTSIPPKTSHAMIPKDVLGERVIGAIERSMRPGS
jgi:acetamidase/formamidase